MAASRNVWVFNGSSEISDQFTAGPLTCTRSNVSDVAPFGQIRFGGAAGAWGGGQANDPFYDLSLDEVGAPELERCCRSHRESPELQRPSGE